MLRADHAADLFAELRVGGEVQCNLPFGVTAEAVQSIHHVRGIADLALFAIAGDVDPDLGLATEHFVHRARNHIGKMTGVISLPLVDAQQDFGKFRGARQAADVRCENAIL